jgi:phosphoserine aminotransferase
MSSHVYNFNPGPAALPRPVLEQIQRELPDFAGTGVSILEVSHRSAAYERMHGQVIQDLRTLLGASEQHAIIFMGGGAQTQFALVAMNLLATTAQADYIITGRWSNSALEEAQKVGRARAVWSSAATGYDRVPPAAAFEVDSRAAYLHYTSNNTIVGTQYGVVPEAGAVPLVCDMSSDLLSRSVDVGRFGVIYAGAQKNMGVAGVTTVIIRRDVLEQCRTDLPTMLSYQHMVATNSLANTPPVFAIYIVGLVAQYLLGQGGLSEVAARNAQKAERLYGVIDSSEGFYRGCAQPDSRSVMNVTFRLRSVELEQRFLADSRKAGMIGLAGHRSVRGIRVSLYNAVPYEWVHVLAQFMTDFQQRCA